MNSPTTLQRKLTLFSFIFKSVRHSFFVNATIINGKAVIPASFLNDKLSQLGAARGQTFSIG